MRVRGTLQGLRDIWCASCCARPFGPWGSIRISAFDWFRPQLPFFHGVDIYASHSISGGPASFPCLFPCPVSLPLFPASSPCSCPLLLSLFMRPASSLPTLPAYAPCPPCLISLVVHPDPSPCILPVRCAYPRGPHHNTPHRLTLHSTLPRYAAPAPLSSARTHTHTQHFIHYTQ